MSQEHSLYQRLAAIEHERWADWQRYLHSCCVENDDGSLTIPAELVQRWERQIQTPYEALSEDEQRSDQLQVDRSWGLIMEERQRCYEFGYQQAEFDCDETLPDDSRQTYYIYREAGNTKWEAILGEVVFYDSSRLPTHMNWTVAPNFVIWKHYDPGMDQWVRRLEKAEIASFSVVMDDQLATFNERGEPVLLKDGSGSQ